jgi:16S rRNA (cytosine967-C5)-methyltransferase
VFRRHPDVLHLKGGRDLTPLLSVQAALLDRAVDWLAPGGRLVFSTCSLEAVEGERQVEDLLARTPGLRIDPIAAAELPMGLVPHASGWLRTLPGDLAETGGVDGFFLARVTKV